MSLAGAACPSPRRPQPAAGAVALEIGRPGGSLRGVACAAGATYAALTVDPTADSAPGPASKSEGGHRLAPPAPRRAVIEARHGATLAWQTELAGSAGPLGRTGGLVVATAGGSGSVAELALRGEPGAVVVALDPATGAARWRLAVDASGWAVIASIAAIGDDVLIAGSFSGSLRIAARVVSSGGKSDGFVARIGAAGEPRWLIRMGGPGADGIHGVAAAGDRIAIAGTFAPAADLLGAPLPSLDERSPHADAFVAELDPAGARRWSTTFGGRLDDSLAGVAIDGRGRIVVAATVRDAVTIGTHRLVALGPADGLVAWWHRDGTTGATLLGGAELDTLTAIAALPGHRVALAGTFTASIQLGGQLHGTGSGDDGFLAILDGTTLLHAWPVTGDGREDPLALCALPDGFTAAIAHSAAAVVDGAALPAPPDRASGAALVTRAVR